MLFIIYLTGTIISAIFFLIGLHKYRTRKALLKLETVTTGVIKSVEKPKLEVKASKDKDTYKITAEYTVDGKTYTTSMGCSMYEDEYREGQTINIIYDGNNPSKAVPKIYADASELNKMVLIFSMIPFVIFVMITAVTAPDTLCMSNETECRYSIVMYSVCFIGAIAAWVFYHMSGLYEKEKKNDLKAAKRSICMLVVILGDCVFEIVENMLMLK